MTSGDLPLAAARAAIARANSAVRGFDEAVLRLKESKPLRLVVARHAAGVWHVEFERKADEHVLRAVDAALRRVVYTTREVFDAAVDAACVAIDADATPGGERSKIGMPRCRALREFPSLRASPEFRNWRPDQIRLMEMYQPFEPSVITHPDHERLRVALRHHADLLDVWEQAPNRVVIDFWLTIKAVTVTSSNGETFRRSLGEAGLVGVRRVAATVHSAEPLTTQAVRPEAEVVLTTSIAGTPVDDHDDVGDRVRLTLAAAERFVAVLESSLGQAPEHTSRFLSLTPADDSAAARAAWAPLRMDHPDDQRLVLERMAHSETGLASYMSADGERAMIVRTPTGVYMRQLPEAVALDPAQRRGTAAEHAAMSAACRWGLPDFVFASHVVSKGNARRELNDATVVVNGYGAAIQVKARDAETLKDAAGEARWLTKKFVDAAGQAAGTVRNLCRQARPLVNERGRTILVDGAAVDWMGVVVLDHPDPPENVTLPQLDLPIPVVGLLRQDWEFLFEQLRSVSAVVEYLRRIPEAEAVPLGEEPARYFELADLDEIDCIAQTRAAPPTGRGRRLFTPALPKRPAGSQDTAGHTMYRLILEDVANMDMGDAVDEGQRLELLGRLDRLHVTDRDELGQLLLQRLDNAVDASHAEPEKTRMEHRLFCQDGHELQLFFSVGSQLSEALTAVHFGWTLTRRRQLIDDLHVPPDKTVHTVSVLLTPRWDEKRLWDITVYALDSHEGFDDTEYRRLAELWADPALRIH